MGVMLETLAASAIGAARTELVEMLKDVVDDGASIGLRERVLLEAARRDE